jgi:malate dehydrogenase (oxaloacetate-decarboxylating)(NADP+)
MLFSLTSIAVFARADYQGPPLTNLVDIINHVKPTALLGLSTIHVSALSLPSAPSCEILCIQNAFTKEVISAMVTHNTRPIIFPLSNPVSLSEIDYEDAVNW